MIPADADGAFAVGATYWEDDGLEPFSSQGPTNDGRIKPELAAPDGVTTMTYGSTNFYGTSASSPHVAGAAALLWSRSPSYTTDEIEYLLKAKALDLDPPGVDNLTGWGRLALMPVVNIVLFPFFDDFETGSANWTLDAPWDVTDEEAHSGDYSLTDSPHTLYDNNVNVSATLIIDLSDANQPLLSFWNRHNFASGDYAYIEFSKDGSSWDRVYYQVGIDLDWKQQQIDLRRYAGIPMVYIRFRLQTDSSSYQDGWYIDDVSVDENTATVAFPFFDDMETTDSDANWIPSRWRRISTSGHSGTSSWRMDTSGSYPDNSNIWLTLSAPLDLSTVANPHLVFWHRYQFINTTNDNAGYVYVSTDGGKNFTTLTYYFRGTQSDFTRAQLDLSPYTGSPQVVIGFMFYWIRGSSSDYWEIDDVAIDTPADPILLHKPQNATQHSLDLSWAKSVTDNFAYYALYRHSSGGWEWVATIDDIDTTQYTDDSLELRRTYYYKIYVVKKGDIFNTASNEVFATTLGVGYPFSDDFESGVTNWDVKPPWDVTAESAHGGDYSLTDSPMTLYGDNINTYVTTGLDLAGSRRPILTFWEMYNLASGDYVYVEISKDNEVNWDRVYFQVGTNLTWTQRRIDLRRYAGESQVRIRFRIQTDGSAIQDGWYIDDVSINEHTTTVAFPFFDDMETTDSDVNWIPSRWRRISTSGHSGTSSWRMDTSGSYPDNSNIWLTLSAPLDLSTVANPHLVFWHRYQFINTTNDNAGYVYVSTDGGKNFTTLTYYFRGTQSDFTRAQLDLSPYTGSPQVVIGFMFYWIRGSSSDYWEIDDVAITDPSVMVDFGQLDSPSNIIVDAGTPTENIYGLVYEAGVTNGEGQGAGIISQLGYGQDGSIPDDNWTWVDATYDSDVDDEPDDKKFDKYVAKLTVGQSGVYDYAYRYRLEISSIWTYADLDGNDLGSDMTSGYSPSQAGDLTVGVVTEPIITSISPDIGPIGELVTITGKNFGDSQGDSTVTINGFDQETADSWSDTAIQITVKEGTTTGPVVVTVGGQVSNNDKIFTVIDCIKGDVNDDGEVKSNDAIICLQIAAGIIEPIDDRQFCAADMNCDGEIKSNDAILILKKAAGIPVPPCSIITVNQTDVSQTPRVVRLKGISYKNGVVNLTIVANNLDDVAGADISLAYNPSGLSLVEVTPPQGTTLVANTNTPGKIKIAWVKLEDIKIDAIAMLSFKVIELKRASLTLKAAQLYDSGALPIPTKIIHRNMESLIIPKDDQLLVNYPNPFNPDTWIPYQLAKASDVTICIYNISGQLVRTLELGRKDAGLYYSRARAAHWDGKNVSGEQVASGVYFYHIKTGDFQATRKLLVTK